MQQQAPTDGRRLFCRREHREKGPLSRRERRASPTRRRAGCRHGERAKQGLYRTRLNFLAEPASSHRQPSEGCADSEGYALVRDFAFYRSAERESPAAVAVYLLFCAAQLQQNSAKYMRTRDETCSGKLKLIRCRLDKIRTDTREFGLDAFRVTRGARLCFYEMRNLLISCVLGYDIISQTGDPWVCMSVLCRVQCCFMSNFKS